MTAPAPVTGTSLRELSRAELRDLATTEVDDARRWWTRALGDGSGRPVLVSILEDWADFSGQDYPTMLTSIFTAKERVSEEWRTSAPETAEDAAAFYDTTDTITPLLLWWHATGARPARCAAAVARLMDAVGGRRVLDLGSGIGSTALALASEGREVLLTEVSEELLRFAAHRLSRRGIPHESVDLRSASLSDLPTASVDAVCVFDVFEHLPDTEPACRDIDRLLRPGGVVCFNQVFVPPEDEPGHYPRRGEVLRWFHDHGYRLAHALGICWAAQKAPLTRGAEARQGIELGVRIGVARAVEGRTGPIGRRLNFYGTRYAVD